MPNHHVPFAAATAVQDNRRVCLPFWTLLEFDGTFTQFTAFDVRFENGASIRLPNGIMASFISLMAIRRHQSGRTSYYFLAVVDGTTSFLFLGNHIVPMDN